MIALFIYVKYKPLYRVTLNGKVIGYVESKGKMQEKIEEFANNLDGNVTSIKIETMPEYKFELVSNVKESETNEAEILAAVKENSEIKCRVYAIKLDGNVKASVNSKEEADQLIETIKSETTEGVVLNFEVEEQEQIKQDAEANVSSIEVAKLSINQDVEVKVEEYKKEQEAAELRRRQEAARKAQQVAVSSRAGTPISSASAGRFLRPVVGGTISSPFGQRRSGFHKGIDIAVPNGTPIYAADNGVVKFSGWNSTGFGNLVIIDHGDGFLTYYAHCSSLYVSAGQSVTKGQNICAVGLTGNTSGYHVHFEVRYNGTSVNPMNYM